MYQFAIPNIDLISILPIILVGLTGAFGLLIEIIRPKANNNLIAMVSVFGLFCAAITVWKGMDGSSSSSYGGMALRDGFGSSIELILLLVAGLSIIFSESYLKEKRIPFGEFYPLLMWATAGAMIMSTSNSLLMIFVGLEALSISLYVLAGMSRSEEKSEEAAIKYFLLGAFASGFLLYGIAFIYGGTGSVDLTQIAHSVQNGAPGSYSLILIGLSLMLVGLCFKTSLVPFHQWTPDVYQGAPTNVTAFMSAASKIGAFAAMWRVLDAFRIIQAVWGPGLFWIAIATMIIGNIAALGQKDVKRILAYSSISHSGYLLVAILAYSKNPLIGYGTLLYYLFSYSFMTVGSFAALTLLTRNGEESTDLSSLNGLWKRNPVAAGSLLILMLSLVGLPPFSGFFGKVLIFKDAVSTGLLPLAIVLALSSIISAIYYLKIAYAAFVADSSESEFGVQTPFSRSPLGAQITCVFAAAGVFLASFFMGPIQAFFNR